jgi:hypothetical protein
LYDSVGLRSDADAADVGAGTGIFTKLERVETIEDFSEEAVLTRLLLFVQQTGSNVNMSYAVRGSAW